MSDVDVESKSDGEGGYALDDDAIPYPVHLVMTKRFCDGALPPTTIKNYTVAIRGHMGSIDDRDGRLLLVEPDTLTTEQTLDWRIEDLKGRLPIDGVIAALKSLQSADAKLFGQIHRQLFSVRIKNLKEELKSAVAIAQDAPIAQFGRNKTIAVDACELEKIPLLREAYGRLKSETQRGYFRRLLGALEIMDQDWRNMAAEDFFAPSTIEIALQSFHIHAEPWRTADRLGELKRTLKCAFLTVSDLKYIANRVSRLRAEYPAPLRPGAKRQAPNRIASQNLLLDEELILLRQCLDAGGDCDDEGEDPEDDINDDEEATFYAKTTEKGILRTLRIFRGALERKALNLAFIPMRDLDIVEAVGVFEKDLATTCRGRVIAARLQELKTVYGLLTGARKGAQFDFIGQRIKERLRSDPRSAVEVPDVSVKALRRAGWAIISEAWRRYIDLKDCEHPYRSLAGLAERYRNGLAVLLLSALPLRVRTLSHLLDASMVVWAVNHFVLVIPGELTKNGLDETQDLPKKMNKAIRRYRVIMRPLIAGAVVVRPPKDGAGEEPRHLKLLTPKSGAFFVSRTDTPFSRDAFQRAVPKMTVDHLGVRITCREFRRIRATDSLALDDGKLGSMFLHHQDEAITRIAYESAARRQKLIELPSKVDLMAGELIVLPL